MSGRRSRIAEALRSHGALCVPAAAGGLFFGPLILALSARLVLGDANVGIQAAGLVYSWPVVSAVCVSLFLAMFREPLAMFIGNVRQFEAAGVKVIVTPLAATDHRRKTIEDWLGGPQSLNRAILRSWLIQAYDWKGSEASWLLTAPAEQLARAMEAMKIGTTGGGT